MSSFVVTTSTSSGSSSRLWDPSRPLPLGHPCRWVIEKTEKGVRARDLSADPGAILDHGAREISDRELGQGAELRLPRLTVRIRPVLRPGRPFEARARAGSKGLPWLFSCIGDAVLDAAPLGEDYSGRAGGKLVFEIRPRRGGVEILPREAGLRLGSRSLAQGQAASIDPAEMNEASLRFGAYAWHFGMLPSTSGAAALDAAPAPDELTAWFHRALRATALGLAALVALSWIWPRPKTETEPLIPPQFAKIVLSQPHKAAAASESASPDSAASPSHKAERAAVVQAFRAKALQNAVSGLLKGGMTRLLAESDIVTGKDASTQARRIFDAASDSLKASGAEIGVSSDHIVKVASIGGAATDGKSVGYGKGSRASVGGQGKGFVSMDIGASSVEEGLTKDEVGEVIHRHLSEVRYCYESAMLRTPDIEGKLIVDFTIGGAGSVKSAEVKQSTLPDPRLDDCIIRRLVTWKFPQPKGGIDVGVSYPFIFKTLGR